MQPFERKNVGKYDIYFSRAKYTSRHQGIQESSTFPPISGILGGIGES